MYKFILVGLVALVAAVIGMGLGAHEMLAQSATADSTCLAGFYDPDGGSACVPADAGYYVPVDGATSQIACPAGTFTSVEGSASCTDAPAGSFVDTAGATSASLCPAGTFTSVEGSISCTDAPPGSFVDTAGATSASPCPAGQYQPAAGQNSCLLADPGNFVDQPGSVVQTQCGAGTYQPAAGQDSCLVADPGFFVDITGAVAQTICPEGTTSEAGAVACEPIGVLPISIDIKPGSNDNCVNINGNGVIPVAVLGSATIDVTTVDVATVELAGMAIKVVGKGSKHLAHIEDVNGDVYPDLVLQIQDEDGTLEEGATQATLSGALTAEYGGTPIEGVDTLCIVP